nr:hypothetical protein YSBCXYJI_YSBCXYJI_CDS_0043 [Caudoviricetes sp.]
MLMTTVKAAGKENKKVYGYAICRATVEDKNVFTVYSGNNITPWVDLQSGNAKIYNNRIEAKTVLKKLLNDKNKLLFLVALG